MQSHFNGRVPDRPSHGAMAAKRTLDILLSVAGLLLLLPVLAVVAVIIKLDSRGPIFFRQERVGQGGRSFRIYKFRTMVVGAAGTALTVRADPRITRAGAFLRRTKLDELPQFINVLLGDMSIVGPRPEVPEFMKLYAPDQRAIILAMRPGITDYAAILFRDESALLSGKRNPIDVYQRVIMPAKFACYERYSREIGTLNDLRIIIATTLLLTTGRIPHWLGIEYCLPTAGLGSTSEAEIHP
ncbi:sugar transferase [Bradyrhizobium sp. LMTR 3]|uniref:sugar transferase n=1 Tax=Bradyrhizobium sp. LMTR 3 TaxID=189873 RepID=UPI000810CDA9|nr:sugar transferase [Bradyrhizobium sp. LMTR 3]OCK54951.1 sugar transferase [Bradyrhizobium sp. LMTR 3]